MDNNMEGKGVYTWADGRRYQGEYFKDKKHGFGKYTWADGRCYEGQWGNGKQHGEGKYTTQSGKVSRVGQWNEGKREKWLDKEEKSDRS